MVGINTAMLQLDKTSLCHKNGVSSGSGHSRRVVTSAAAKSGVEVEGEKPTKTKRKASAKTKKQSAAGSAKQAAKKPNSNLLEAALANRNTKSGGSAKSNGSANDNLLAIALANREALTVARGNVDKIKNGTAARPSARASRPAPARQAASPRQARQNKVTNGSSDPNANLLAIALAQREALQVAQRNQTRSRGDVSTKATQQASYETSRSNGSGPNDNLLALALAERQKNGFGVGRSSTPSRSSPSRNSTPTRSSSRPASRPAARSSQPSYQTSNNNGGSSNGANDNLLAIALAERAKGGSRSSSRSSTPSPTRGRAPTPSRSSTPVRSSRPSYEAPQSNGSGPNDNLLAIAMAARGQGSSRSSSRASTPTRSSRPSTPTRSSTPTRGRPAASSRPSYESSRSSGSSDPNANLLELAMAERARGSSSRSSSRSSTPSPTRGRAPTPPPTRGRSATPTRSSRPSYEAPRSSSNGGSDPNANLLEQAMAARAQGGSRSSTPSRGRASTPVRSSRPSTPSPTRGRPSYEAPRSSGSSDPNGNLLEQAMAARAQGASSRSSSRSSTPTRGRAPTPPPTRGRSATPVRSSRPSYEAPRSSSSGGSDPNANLLEQAMAARSRSSSRSSTPSPTRGRAPTPPPTRGRSATPVRSSRPSYEAPRSNGSDPNANLLEQAMAARSRSSSRSSTPSPTRGRAPPARSSTPARSSRPSYEAPRSSGSDPNANLLELAMAERARGSSSRSSSRSSTPSPTRGRAPTPTRGRPSTPARSSRPSYEAPKSSGSDPNANLLEQAMAARAQGASSRPSSRSSTPPPTRGRSATPVRSSRPSTPSPTRGRPSYEAPRSNGNGGSGANDNLLAIALAERAKGGSSRSSSRGRAPTPSPTRGRSSTPVRSSRPSTPSPTRGRPSYEAPRSNGSGDNDNLLAAAMAYRQQNSGRSGGRSSGRGAYAGSSRNEEQQSSSVRDGIRSGADALKRGIDSAPASPRGASDEFQKRAYQAADQLDDSVKNAGGKVQEAIDNAPEKVAGAVQQAVDATAEGIRGARSIGRELQKPGPKAPFQDTPLTSLDASPDKGDDQGTKIKKRLLYVVSGLDRGFSASSAAIAEVEANIASLLSIAQPVNLSWTPAKEDKPSTLALLNGTWRLVYSSAFAKGGAPTLPGYKLGQVYQAIAAYSSRLDNIVEFYGTINLPSLPGLPPVDPIVLTTNLKHYFEPVGGSTVSITFEDTEVKGTGGFNGLLGKLPQFALPQLPEGFRPSRESRTSTFEEIFLDEDTRITRGARGELRVFVRT